MSSSIFAYEINFPSTNIASVIYQTLSDLPDDETNYFNLQLISPTALFGEYITVQIVEESFYDTITRTFEKRQTTKANVINFNINDCYLEIWGNKTHANRLVFAIAKAFHNNISINSIEVSITDIITKLHEYKAKVSKVCFEDFLFTEDIVGNFTVDLSSYGDVFSVLEKYKEKISKLTFTLPCNGVSLKITITSKGTITVYKMRDSYDDEALELLHSILFKRG